MPSSCETQASKPQVLSGSEAVGLARESSVSRAGTALAREWPGRGCDAGACASAHTSNSASKGCLSQAVSNSKTGVWSESLCRLSRHQMSTKWGAGLPWAVGPWRGATAACPVGAGTRVRAAGVFARWWARCPAPFHDAAAAARFLWILLESSVPRQATLSLFLPDSCVSGSRCSHSLYLFCSMVYLGNSNTYKAALFFILSLNFLL